MQLISSKYLNFSIVFIFSVLFSYAQEFLNLPDNRVMTVEEFEKALNSNEFLKEEGLTTIDQPLDEDEIEFIETALACENKNYGGLFKPAREIKDFTGSTLFVGGGKIPGLCGENDGKMILFDYFSEEKQVMELVEKLRTGDWSYDLYTGKTFETALEKETYINQLIEKLAIYKKAFKEKNKDILSQYYILNIEDKILPDMVASITSISDMSKIPDNKFMHVEFENVPIYVFLNPNIYKILERITKPGGTIKFRVDRIGRRIIVPVVQQTKFGKQFTEILKREMYNKPEVINSNHASCEIMLINQ